MSLFANSSYEVSNSFVRESVVQEPIQIRSAAILWVGEIAN